LSLTHSTQNEELCPNCGNFVNELNEVSGFCLDCSPNGVGFSGKKPEFSRLENWLHKNASVIEETMLARNQAAKVVIREIMLNSKAVCVICGSNIDHGTKDRHKICRKTPQCKKARRYYSYLKYEKGMTPEKALEAVVAKFKQEKAT
jgi:predicted RNA-binding Zn-ribbon protein involved in translation (DUF1610 family)